MDFNLLDVVHMHRQIKLKNCPEDAWRHNSAQAKHLPACAGTPSLRAFFCSLLCALAASAAATSAAMLFLPGRPASPPCVTALDAFSSTCKPYITLASSSS